MAGGEADEVVQGCQSGVGGFDGVAGFVEEAPGLADGPVEALGNHSEERGDRHLRKPVSLVEEGGQEPVDEGEAGAPAGVATGRGRFLPVTAASLVEVLPAGLLVPCSVRR